MSKLRDAPVTDLSLLPERFERAHRVRERITPAPVEEVQIDAIGPHPTQALLARRDRAAEAGVLWQHLADDENFVALSADRFTDDGLGAAVAVHLGRVDQRDTQVEPEASAATSLA